MVSQSAILEAYVEQALNSNLQIQNQRLSASRQNIEIDRAKRLWTPEVNINASYLLAEGGRRINFPVGDLFNPAYGTLNQLTDSDAFPTDLENLETQLTPTNFLDAQLSISQPILNSTIRHNRRIQESLLGIQNIEIDKTRREISYQVKSAYFNHLKTIEGLRIIDSNRQLLEEILEFNKKLVKYDKANNDIISDVSFQLESLASDKAQLNEQRETTKALFNLLLNRPLGTPIVVDTTLLLENEMLLPSMEELYNSALRFREETQLLNSQDELIKIDQERIRDERLPELGLTAGVGIQTEHFSFDDGGPLYTAGVGIRINLFDGGKRNLQIQSRQVERDLVKNQKDQFGQQARLEVLSAYFEIQSTMSQLKSEKSATRHAQRSLDITKSKYKNNRALLIEVLEAQTRLITGQMRSVVTGYDLLISKANLEKIIASPI